MTPYVPFTEMERRALLDAVGVAVPDDLFADVPAALLNPPIELPPALSELELRRAMQALGDANRTDPLCFAGYGAYDHFIPAAVDTLASRGEFVTSYTPYQAEISQGNLQAIYEYQTMVADLCGCEVANASLHDGATALYEAVLMAVRIGRGRTHVVLDGALHPHARAVLHTYAAHQDLRMAVVNPVNGLTDPARLAAEIDAETAVVVTASPNVFGAVSDLRPLAAAAHEAGALLACATHPLAGGVLTPPGAMGADIVFGEGQPLGLPLSYGGPYLGFLAGRRAHIRAMPGRLVGATVDTQGRRAFCLALQTREQHIRREKATSNICTNQALCALRAAIYLALLGETGVRRAAEHCVSLAALARRRLADVPGVEPRWDYPCFNEFVVHTRRPAADVVAGALRHGVLAGVSLEPLGPEYQNALLVAVTEQRTPADIEALATALQAEAG